METFKVENLTFRYPETGVDVLKNISFKIFEGEFITLCGPSGCGKSTLLRQLKPSLAQFGIKSGNIYFENSKLEEISQRNQSEKIGFVLQSPENQIVTDKVWHELAFGLESLGYDTNTIRKRVAETASFFGIQNWFDKNVSELSGGQKQLLNLASIMAMEPSVLILDEPTSQLDPIASSEFLSCISKINRELGITIIITEHRLDEVMPLSDRVMVMEKGEVISFDTPLKTGEKLKAINSKIFLSLPAPMQIWSEVEKGENPCPITVSQGKKWLEDFCENHSLNELPKEIIPTHENEVSVDLENIWFRYAKNEKDIVKGLNFKAYKGEFVAILGGNGTGKTTALSIINGLNIPYRGKVKILPSQEKTDGVKVATLPQNPQTMFVKKTVREDLLEVFDGTEIEKSDRERRVLQVVNLCQLQNFLDRHPYDLSGGEQQRTALAKVLLLTPQILLLDEPTKGIDAEFKENFASIIDTICQSGVMVIMVSHDVEFCAKYAHRCAMFFNGEIVSENTPRNFFASNNFYATCASRMARSKIPKAVTCEDVIYCCSGKGCDKHPHFTTQLYDISPKEEIKKDKKIKTPVWKKILGVFSALFLLFSICVNLDYFSFLPSNQLELWQNVLILLIPVILLIFSIAKKSEKPKDEIFTPKNQRKIPKRTICSAVMILLLIPLTVFIGVVYLGDNKYLFISLLVLLECMTPFFLIFEGRKPQAREIVIISVLCAITVASRIAFYMLPQFKPVLALVIIAGVAFGAESGFLVGAVSMLVSNIIFQQGPWTPWQMFAMGIVGFVAGVLFKKGLLARSKISLCVFGFVTAIIIYGPIVNFSSLVMSHAQMNFPTLISFFVTGLPMDIVHGVATALFLYFGAEPMLEKLDRVKIKYGLVKVV